MSFFSSLFGGGSQSTTQGVDPETAAFIQRYRYLAAQQQAQPGYAGLEGINQYFDPYQQDVIGGVQSDFDRQRAIANNMAGDQATRAGAYGGSREAVLRSLGLNDVNRNETSTLANLRSGGFTQAMNALFQNRAMNDQNRWQGLQALLPGFNPTSQTTTTRSNASPFSQLAGLGLGIGGMLLSGGASAAVPALAGSFGSSGGAPGSSATSGFNPPQFGSSWGGGGGWQPQFSQQSPWPGFGVR